MNKKLVFFGLYTLLFVSVTVFSIESIGLIEAHTTWFFACFSGAMINGFVTQFMDIIVLEDY